MLFSEAARRLEALFGLALRKRIFSWALIVVLAPAVDAASEVGNVTPQRLLKADSEPGAWLTGGRDYRQTYYSPLTSISPANISRLGYAWSYDIDFTTAFEATPTVVDGMMFTSGNRGNVYALDAKSGRLVWSFKPTIDPQILTKLCCTDVNRGVVVWRGRIYVGSIDGYLYSLDASTGAVLWKVDTITDRSRAYSITGAPYIAKELVVIGNSGAEFDTRGYVTAYDAQTGKQAWRFFTVPGDPKLGFEHPELEMAAKTWAPDSRWDVGLGGTVWDGMAYDPKLNLLYVGTGNGGPWNRAIRSPSGGDNLFLASILALNPDTGRLVWYYQTTPSEAWDYTATQKLILADLKIDGRMRGVLMQAPKNGFFYVLDRKTGSLISATPYTEITWASRVDLSGRPLETGQGDYSKGAKLLFPGPFGGHQWQPMSYNLKTGLVYIPVQQIPMVYSPAKQPFVYQHARTNMGTEVTGFTAGGWLSQSGSATLPALDDVLKGQPNPRPHLYLQAWDPVKSAIAWQVEITGELDPSVEFLRRAGGVMSTASGLVFQGGPDGYLRVYDARTGKSLHSINVGTSILAAPMTYRIGGEQYVALMAGVGEYDGYVDQLYGKKGRIVAFKLGGGEVPLRPALPRAAPGMEAPSVPRFGTPQQLSVGESLFSRHCAICHAEGRAPNLKRMSAQTHLEFSDIVLKGSRSSEGMGNFGNVLSTDDAQAIHAYIVDSAWQEFERQPSNPESSRREQP